MTTIDALPVDILHHIAQSCGKSELLSLRLSNRNISTFLLPYVDKYLAFEVRLGIHFHLHRAAAASTSSNHNYTILQRLLKTKVPINQRDKRGETALHIASRHGNLSGVRSLLDAGADVDAVSSHEWTPLRLACRYGYSDIVRLLLEFGADVNRSGFYGWTALYYAVLNGYGECVKVLVEYGAADTITSQGARRVAAKSVKQQWGIYKFHVKT